MWQAIIISFVAFGIATYVPEGNPDGVELQEGEKVERISPDNVGWTSVKKSNGREGIVPTSFLRD